MNEASQSTRWLVALALLGLCAAAFSGVAQLGFVGLDDPEYLGRNPVVLEGLTAEGLTYAFTSFDMGNWHPLTWLSHLLAVELFGVEPGPHHVVNLVLHALATLACFALVLELTDRLWPSALVAALFCVHPLHVESVAWVAERKDVLSTLWWMAATWAWVRWVRTGARAWYVASAVALAAGLASKPMLVTLPLTLLLLDSWPLRRWRGVEAEAGHSAGRLVIEKAPLFALSLLSGIVTLVAQADSGATRAVEGLGALDRLANALRSIGVYLRQTLWPADLAVFYPHPGEVPVGQVALAGLAVLVLSAAAWHGRRRAPWVLVGWLWFLVTLAPVLGLLQVGGQAHADRYTYVPHVGLFLALAFSLDALAASSRARALAGLALSLAILAALTLTTRAQVRVWRDDESLFTQALEATEGNYLAHDYMGRLRRDQRRNEEALVHLRESVRARPEFVSAHVNLGMTLVDVGDLLGAVESFRAALALQPDLVLIHANLGTALAKLERHDEAAAVFEEALRLEPDAVGVRMNAVLNELLRGRIAAAVEHYRRALQLDPELIAHDQALYLAWMMATHPDPAARDGALAVRIAEPVCARTGRRAAMPLEALAASYAETGRFADALRTVNEALVIANAEGLPDLIGRLEAARERYAASEPFRIDG